MQGSQDSVTREFKTCSYQILQQRRPLFQPTTTNDAQLTKTSSGAAETTASRISPVRAMWLRARRCQSSLRTRPHAAHGSDTEDNDCSQKALRSCAISTVQPEKPVAPSGRGGVGCNFFGSDTPIRDLRVGHSSWTDGNPDTRVQRPAARPPVSILLRARSWCLQVTSSTTARFQTAPLGTLFSQSGTSNFSPRFAEPPRWHSPAAMSLDVSQHGQKASEEQ